MWCAVRSLFQIQRRIFRLFDDGATSIRAIRTIFAMLCEKRFVNLIKVACRAESSRSISKEIQAKPQPSSEEACNQTPGHAMRCSGGSSPGLDPFQFHVGTAVRANRLTQSGNGKACTMRSRELYSISSVSNSNIFHI